MTSRKGHRGYIGSRPYQDARTPQHVQNLVVRDYCQRNGFSYLLSVTEYAMPGCYVMLEELLREVDRLEGVVLYSIFMLPRRREHRFDVCRRVLAMGATLHDALENLAIRTEADLTTIEDIRRIQTLQADNSALRDLIALG